MKITIVTSLILFFIYQPVAHFENALPRPIILRNFLVDNGCWPLAGPHFLYPIMSDDELPIDVNIQGWFDIVTEIDEKKQRMSMTGNIGISWQVKCANFEHLKDFDDLRNIHLDGNNLWRLTISHQNTADLFFLDSSGRALNRARLYRNGTIKQWYAGTFNSHCHFDFYLFPFDQQKCELIFESFETDKIVNFTLHRHQLGPVNDQVGDFQILSSKFDASVNTIVEQGLTLFQVIFTIHFKRSSEYYVIVLIVPLLFLMLIQQSAHFVPICVERCSIHLTILLAINLLQQTLDANSPHLDTTPLICYFLLGFMATATLQCCYTLTLLIFSIEKFTKKIVQILSFKIKMAKLIDVFMFLFTLFFNISSLVVLLSKGLS